MFNSIRKHAFASALMCASTFAGCTHCEKCADMGDLTPHPQGTLSDPVWQQQEANAEASDFVVHEHEWNGNTVDLNDAGKDHVKQIAARLEATPFPVIIERSSMSVDPESRFKYPVNNDADLDLERRELIVSALNSMGIYNAEDRVVVGPALTPGIESPQGRRAYQRGMSGLNGSGVGLGGFGGGFGGGGGIGGGVGAF